jgi:hypothetical protein
MPQSPHASPSAFNALSRAPLAVVERHGARLAERSRRSAQSAQCTRNSETSRRASGCGASRTPTGLRNATGRRWWPRPASSPTERSRCLTRSRLAANWASCGIALTLGRRRCSSCSSLTTSATSTTSRAATGLARRPQALLARRRPRDQPRADRTGQRAAGRPARPLRRPWPQRDAALAARAAHPRLRRRADGPRRRAARLVHAVARGTRAPGVARAARAPVRACDRLARRADARQSRLRASARAAAVGRLRPRPPDPGGASRPAASRHRPPSAPRRCSARRRRASRCRTGRRRRACRRRWRRPRARAPR